MTKTIINEYEPKTVSQPGESLLEMLETLSISQAELAERTGRHRKTINEIIKGKSSITPETAIQLEKVLGIPASFWNNRQKHYDEWLAKQREHEELKKHVDWMDEFPIKKMIKLGWLEPSKHKVTLLNRLLCFFGVASPEVWETRWEHMQLAFRQTKKFTFDNYALAVWLRKGSIEAQNIECEPFNREKFLKTLVKIRGLTIEPPVVFQPELIKLCASCGVAVAFVPELPKIRVFGVTRWLSPDRALIQISLRYKTDDQLWFTFFHEAGHVLQEQKKAIYIESGKSGEMYEKKANAFAANMLIPVGKLEEFVKTKHLITSTIRRFADEQGIAPGIVVGQLQHKKYLSWNTECNKLKRSFRWVE